MSYLQTQEGTFGPFLAIEALADGWRCDGIWIASAVVGSGQIVFGSLDLPDVPPPVPERVSMFAARTVLYRAGLLEAVEQAISDMPGEAGDLARIKWATALTVARADELVVQMIPSLGKTEVEIDGMFIEAATIDAGA